MPVTGAVPHRKSLAGVRILITLSQCLSGGDAAFMTISLAIIGRQLHVGPSVVQWLLSAELLTCGGFLVLGGRLVDLLGIRRMFLVGAILFTLGALPGLLSTDLALILPGRVLAGLGIACVNPAILGLIVETFPKGVGRDRAFGLFSLGQNIGFFGGIMLGGMVVTLAGWHGAFGMDLILGSASMALGTTCLSPGGARQSLKGLDVPGAVTATLGVGLLIFALSSFGSGLVTVTWALLGAALLLSVFAVLERRTARPLLPLLVFRAPNIGASAALILLINALAIATMVSSLFYAQQLGHLPPASAAFLFVPALVVATMAARLVPRALARFAPRSVVLAGLAAYMAVLVLALVNGETLNAPRLAFAMALVGICLSSFGSVAGIITVYAEATASAPMADRGVVSAMLLAVAQIGGAVGVAVSAATLAAHPAGVTENFALTFVTIAAAASLGGAVTVVFFKATQPRLAARAH